VIGSVDAQDGYPGGWPSQLGSAEIETASADATCRQQVNIMGMWSALLTAYEDQIVRTTLPQLATAKRVTDQWLRNAAAFGH